MYNSKLTNDPFDGNLTVKRGYKLITDAQGRPLGTLSGKEILDLNGKQIATLERVEIAPNAAGKKQKSRFYTSPKGEMRLFDSVLFVDGEPLGKIPARERSVSHIVMLSVATLMLLATMMFVWLIDIPFADVPTIEVKDNQGTWEAQGTIAVLDSSIAPGSSGEYVFILENPHNTSLSYSFAIKEFYNGEEVSDFPLEFRVRMNNVLLETEEWLSAEELQYTEMIMLPDSMHRFTLEWRWQFEQGDDARDTYFGETNGAYTLEFQMTAQTQEEG